jgi:antirestriction protein ArdC
MAKTYAEIQQMVMEKIKGQLPAWVRGYDVSSVMPTNPVTNRPYRGGNALLGMFAGAQFGSTRFATKNQWYKLAKELGYFEDGSRPLLKRDPETGKVVYGELFYYADTTLKRVDSADDVPDIYLVEKNGKLYREYRLFKCFIVYNLNQLADELIPLVEEHLAKDKKEVETDERFEEFLAKVGIVPKHGSPSYSPLSDTVRMPPREAFNNLSEYGATMTHEIGHWTGAASRCNREGVTKLDFFGTDQYAEEEAVAEWFSLLLCNEFGLIRTEDHIDNRAAYIQGWTKRFAQDPELLQRTFQAAEKAFNWIMSEIGIEKETPEVEEAVA